ncbi:MAG: AsmA family protein [Endozoicomonas sp.]
MNLVRKPLKWLVAVVATSLLLLLIVLAIGVRIDLSPWREPLLKAVNDALPYQLEVAGDLEAELSLRPAVRITGVSLAPEDDAGETLAEVGLVSGRLSLLPLLRRRIDIDYFQVEDVDLLLVRDGNGRANWETVDSPDSQDTEAPRGDGAETPSNSDFVVYDFDLRSQITFRNLIVQYQDQSQNLTVNASLEQLTAELQGEDDLHLTASGDFQDQPWTMESSTSLKALLRGRDSHLDLQATLADVRIHLSGNRTLGADRGSALNLEASLPSAESVQQLLGPDLAVYAPASVKAQIRSRPDQLWLENIAIELAGSDLQGRLNLHRGEPSKVGGELTMSNLDLSPWLEPGSSENVATPDDEAPETANEDAESDSAADDKGGKPVPVYQLVSQWLNRAEVGVQVNIQQVKGLPVTMENLGMEMQVSEGKLIIPMGVDVAGVGFRGRVVTEAKEKRMNARVTLRARNADIGELVTGLTGTPAEGYVERARITVRTNGRRIRNLVNRARLNFILEQGQLAFEDEVPWQVNTAEARVGLRRQTEILFDARLLTIPVNLTMEAEPLIWLRQGKPWNLTMNVDSPAFTASAQGFISEQGVREGGEFNIDFSAPRLGDLAPWLGVRPDVDAPLVLKGKILTEGDRLRLLLPDFRAGQSKGHVTFSWDSSGESAFADFDGRLQQLHLDEMSGFWPEPTDDQQETTVRSASEEKGLNLNIPVLSSEITIADADLGFAIDRMVVGGQEVKDIRMSGSVRDGWLQKAPFSAEYVNSRFYGDMALDLRTRELGLDFNLAVDNPDLGRMLSELNFAEDMKLKLDKARFALRLKGETPIELMRRATLDARLTGGIWTLQDPNSGASTDILLSNGAITAEPGKPLSLDVAGELKTLPVNIKASTLPLDGLLRRNRQVPLSLDAAIADMSLRTHSLVTLPIEQRTMELEVELTGPSLSQLNDLFEMSLPPYGPLRMAGHFSTTAAGYELKDFEFQVAESSLNGYLSLDTRDKPDLKIQLQAPSIQVNDFQLKGWQAWSQPVHQAPGQPGRPGQPGSQEENAPDSQPSLLSPDVLRALNAELKLNVDEVLSGEDQLGRGQLHLQLHDAEVVLDPLYVALPGGEVRVSGHLRPLGEGFSIGLKADVDRLDYGVLARRVDPETSMQGDVSFRLNIATQALTPDDLFSHAGGEMAFAVWPREFEAGIIDLWAVSLASAVLPRLGPSDPSQVNCLVGSFNLEDGRMADNVLMLDTSAMQVLGNTQADFARQDIDLVLIPRAKTAQIFGIELPVKVSGKFQDFGIGVPTSQLVVTTLRFVTSPVLAPMRWILEKSPPANGSQLCEAVFSQGAR